MQLPVGILLDRYGPRRVEPVLLALASLGAALFAWSDTIAGLTVARAVIGAGVCACLMAPLKAIAAWYPPDRQASYSGWIMVAGGIGALAATVPVELALRVASWRMVFAVLAAMTLAVALFIYLRVPDIDKPAGSGSLATQAAGVRDVMMHPRFWWIAPLGALAMGSFMAVQGLWAVPWMMEVEGMSRAQAADYLLVMNAVIMVGYVMIGLFGTRLARHGIHCARTCSAWASRSISRRSRRSSCASRARCCGGRCTGSAPRRTCWASLRSTKASRARSPAAPTRRSTS